MEVPPGLAPFTFALFRDVPGIVHGVTRRDRGLWRDGDMSYATGGDGTAVFATRRAWGARLGFDAAAVVAARQVHGAAVAQVTAADRGRGARDLAGAVADCDALLTAAPDTPILMCFADCAPILLHDPARGVVGIAHAGWRGTVADVAGAAIRALAARYGSDPADIRAGIGPAIGPCCYIVGPEVVAAWRALGVADDEVALEIAPAGGRRQWRFDLPRANRLLLERAGLRPANIEAGAICTACQVADYPSHRAEGGRAGRFAAIIGLTTGVA